MDNRDNLRIGLSIREVQAAIKRYGPNKIEAEKTAVWKKIIKSFLSPISLMFIIAAGLSYVSGKIFDFYFILFLMFLNFFVSFWQERKADNAIEQLNKLLRLVVDVLRDGQWQQLDSERLVPGDLIRLYIGDVVPADLKIVEQKNFSVNEASLTGESMPVEKADSDPVYAGSFVVTGQAEARVKATGQHTYFGKIILSVEDKPKRSLLEKDILTISRSLSILSLFAVLVLTAVFSLSHLSFLETATLDLSLIIAGIPIALPTVLTLIISFGVLKLSKENVIVRRLASLEDLANVNLLFTDKTGTLTKNEISVKRVITYGLNEEDILSYAYFVASGNDHDLINQTIINKAEALGLNLKKFRVSGFIPADSERKRSSADVMYNDRTTRVELGAPQAVERLCRTDDVIRNSLDKDVKQAAEDGYRALALAVGPPGASENLQLAGLLLLSDQLRPDAKQTIDFLTGNGVRVKMLTGDHRAIGNRIGKDLGLDPSDVYSEVLPADKYELVARAKKNYVVAVTGDGVNDLPAIKAADAGFAVSNSVSALKSAADIVLLSPGISVITTAIVEARKIFARINSYAIYRISESLRLVFTILILGLIYRSYPLTPIQLILLAIMNDIPIVALAFNRVRVSSKPAQIQVRKRFFISFLYGMVGVFNSLIFLAILLEWFNYDWQVISTAFFLKLTVGGHLLVLVAHTKERWYKFLPSKEVLLAVLLTQTTATCLAVFGIFMNKIPVPLAVFTWLWTIFWMQISDYMKILQKFFSKRPKRPAPPL